MSLLSKSGIFSKSILSGFWAIKNEVFFPGKMKVMGGDKDARLLRWCDIIEYTPRKILCAANFRLVFIFSLLFTYILLFCGSKDITWTDMRWEERERELNFIYPFFFGFFLKQTLYLAIFVPEAIISVKYLRK